MITKFKIFEDKTSMERVINVNDFFRVFESIWDDNEERLYKYVKRFRKISADLGAAIHVVSAENVAEQLIKNILLDKNVEFTDPDTGKLIRIQVLKCEILYHLTGWSPSKKIARLESYRYGNSTKTYTYNISGDIKIYDLDWIDIELLNKIDEIYREKKFNL